MGSFSLSHILILVIIYIVFFKRNNITELGSSLGKAIRNFKNAMNEIEVDAKDIHDDPKLTSGKSSQQNTQTTNTKERETKS